MKELDLLLEKVKDLSEDNIIFTVRRRKEPFGGYDMAISDSIVLIVDGFGKTLVESYEDLTKNLKKKFNISLI